MFLEVLTSLQNIYFRLLREARKTAIASAYLMPLEIEQQEYFENMLRKMVSHLPKQF